MNNSARDNDTALIRNFCILAHIDHGKSTLADRFLELTGTIEKRKMREQFLDLHPLEREKGITIKMQPVRMLYKTRTGADVARTGADVAQTNADNPKTQMSADSQLLYEEITYQIRGAVFEVRKELGSGHKENVYQNALEIALRRNNLPFEKEKSVDVIYAGERVGVYRPDFVIDDKILLELKALPFIGKNEERQVWNYLRGTPYRLALLVNFGPNGADIRRVVYDSARSNSLQSSALSPQESAYTLNLIDTPGHVDFTYEVSRALAAVEGAILLVDATQGVQAQTIANLALAQRENLVIIPAINKIDLPSAEIEKTEEEIMSILAIPGITPASIHKISGKTGEGVDGLLRSIIEQVPPPSSKGRADMADTGAEISRPPAADSSNTAQLRALVFDSQFDPYLGVIAHIRIIDGMLRKGEAVRFLGTSAECEALEAGVFVPARLQVESLSEGEIGYIATGIKEPEMIHVGDTITNVKYETRNTKHEIVKVKPLSGYREPTPMVFASIFPENQDEYEALREALKKLKLEDSALTFEPEDSGALGRGMRTGFLGMLHMEIVSERLRREYNLELVFSSPSVSFRVTVRTVANRTQTDAAGRAIIYSASKLPGPNEIEHIEEPWVVVELITPGNYIGALTTLVNEREGTITDTTTLGQERVLLRFEAPLREIIIDFYDKLKSVTQGYASMAYEMLGFRRGELTRLDILVAGEKIAAFSEIIPREKAYHIGLARVARLKELLPRELFEVALQAEVDGRIIARETIPALKKDVAGYLYGGDRTRKMKLWKKQQKGKKRLKEAGRVEIPHDVFLKMLKK